MGGGTRKEPTTTTPDTPVSIADGQEDPVADPAAMQHVFLLCHREVEGTDLSTESAEQLAASLEAAGYQVTWSRSPIDSKRLLENYRPSIVVLDPMVCSADGIEFQMVDRLQQRDDPVPLVIVVDEKAELQETRRIKALFKDVLVRPFGTEELQLRIEEALLAKQRYLSLQGHARRLEGEVIRDFKTGLYTERHFRHVLRQEFQRAERHRAPLSFLLIDMDDFKSINDKHDYAFGEFVLTEFAAILRRSIRDIDHAARFGGDEFMVLLPATSPAEAVQVAGRFHNQLVRQIFDNSTYRAKVTISIGIDTYDGRGVSSPEDLRRRANLALKEAKARGKNKIWLYAGSSDGSDSGTRGHSPSEQQLGDE